MTDVKQLGFESNVYKADEVEILHKTTIKLGKVDYLDIGRRDCPVDVEVEVRSVKTDNERLTIDLEPTRSYCELSMCGNIWQANERDIYSGGQIYDTLLELYPDNPLVVEMVKVWKQWHLNNLKAGSRRQAEVIDAYKRDNPLWQYDYSEACEILKAKGLYEDNGYKYGHDWLIEPLPDDIIEQVKSW